MMRMAGVVVVALLAAATAWPDDLHDRVSHRFADSAGVKIHYATAGG